MRTVADSVYLVSWTAVFWTGNAVRIRMYSLFGAVERHAGKGRIFPRVSYLSTDTHTPTKTNTQSVQT